ncbi:poly-gamma-glutamate hydrolase family protein [Acetobacterium sp. UBA5834]|uniref:poly-gamma-glutamate hydrolase family protein n=1 Tax=Acetobacterium sp. UBA5834 TaxID=1945907 RepID=UPI00257B0DDD|nr:poly-gamma-glutamate hydrolase family protein [Acetobacterium sp. UBA5834]
MKKSKIMAVIAGLFLTCALALPVQSVSAADLYANYGELSAVKVQGTDYKIASRNTTSDLAIVAIHGGMIEPGTSELADAIAGSNYKFYGFYGIMKSDNFSLHITSTNFDEPIARSLVQSSKKTLSVHGYSSSEKLTYVSGLDTTMVNKVKESLTAAGYQVADPPGYLAGTSQANIANDNLNHAGVQIELSTGLRATFFSALTSKGLQSKTPEFSKYVNAIKAGLV